MFAPGGSPNYGNISSRSGLSSKTEGPGEEGAAGYCLKILLLLGGSETGTLTFWEFSDIFLFVYSHLLPL